MSFTIRAKWHAPGRIALALLLACFLVLGLCVRNWSSDRNRERSYGGQRRGLHPVNPTLVVYILSLADDAYIENFYFFYHEAVLRDDTAQYDILLARDFEPATLLPDLPSHARYVKYDRGCRGLGLVRWHLTNRNDSDAQHFVLVTSAVRGPFIPPGLRGMMTWHAALGADLGPRTGLAGGVVSCAQPADSGEADPPLNPFVEFTALAASRAAVDLLLHLPEEDLPYCPAAAVAAAAGPAAAAGDLPVAAAAALDPAAVVAADGLTAEAAEAMRALRVWSGSVLAAGLGLASLAVRQRGVAWADEGTWRCNAGVSPLAEHANDGQSLSPYEAMFVPVSAYDDVDMPYGSTPEVARAYAEWMQAAADDSESYYEQIDDAESLDAGASLEPPPQHRSDLAARNRYFGLGNTYKLPAVLLAVALGEACFDAEHFQRANPDIASLPTRDMWKFFVFQGQFQPRPFRLKCGLDWSKFGLRGASGKKSGGAAAARGSSKEAGKGARGQEPG